MNLVLLFLHTPGRQEQSLGNFCFISCVDVSNSQLDPRLKDFSPFLHPFPSVLPDSMPQISDGLEPAALPECQGVPAPVSA